MTYDSTGRLVRKTAQKTDGTNGANNLRYTLEYGYDLNNNITRLTNRTPLRDVVSKYTYGKDNLLTKYEISSEKIVSYTYDGLNRLTGTSLSTTCPINTSYTYYDSERGSGYTTTKLKSEVIDGVTYTYYYDTLGNITDITKDGEDLYCYEYDSMNQLTFVYDYERSMSYSYTYDTGGNILAENVRKLNSNGVAYDTQTNLYSYGDSNWKDKLTSYNGQTITYDAIGNPLSYRDSMTMTWKNGRQLSTLSSGSDSASYTYDSDSVRVSKTVNGVKCTYEYLNGMLLYETRGDAKFWYSYDANGTLYNVKYTLTDDGTAYSYFYTHNSRGDIVGIYSGSGVLTVQYEYDAWGNVISITDRNGNAITNANNIGNLNPFRYRGYYYDSESGFYYLMSRYYDPVTHRFINADGYFQSGSNILDTNMSAYCRNNPIMCIDSNGCAPKTLFQLQQDLADSEKKLNYNIVDLTALYRKGYTSTDTFKILDDGTIIHYDVWNQVADSFGAVFWSLEVDADIGFGVGLSIHEIGEIDLIAKYSPLALHFDEQGFKFGEIQPTEASGGILGWDMFSFGDSKFKEFGNNDSVENFGGSNKLGMSVGTYVGIGGSIGFGWNLDYISNRFNEIWS